MKMVKKNRSHFPTRFLKLLLVLALMLATCVVPAHAKTVSSARADNIFFYAVNGSGQSVLLKVMPLSQMKALAHGQADGRNYYISTTDNYPTTQYCEARGFTVKELVDHVKSVSTVKGADKITFSGSDTLRLMATDSYGNYSRSWTWNDLYGVPRYYFEGLFSNTTGWNTGWEVAGEDNSKFGVTLEDYNRSYKGSDPYYTDKRAVFARGEETSVVLATESYSGRTTSETLVASTEPGISSYITKNGGTVAGCLGDVISDEYALRLSLPMTEADLMAGHRTAYDNFKWIYNMQLDMSSHPAIPSLGEVAETIPSFARNGNTLTITLSCATAGASIYYGYDGSPQILYTGPITYDITGRNLDSEPVTVYATAVKEGYSDAGVLTLKYPGMAPAFKTIYSSTTGSALVFEGAESVTVSDWSAWTKAMSFISMKTPSISGYATVDSSKYRIDNKAKTITFDGSLFTETGSCSFIFHASKYANKNTSVTMKKASLTVNAEPAYAFGSPVTLTFSDPEYQKALSIYVSDESGSRTMISASYLDRTQAGKVTIKEEYFTLASSVMKEPETYTLELNNNNYTPATQNVEITLTSGFVDVAPDAWYYSYVTELTEAGVVNGMGGGRFVPEGTVTWGQALKLLMLATGYEEQKAVSTHWASGYMAKAGADGITDYAGSPDEPITRIDFCRAAANALKSETTLTATPFTDTNDPAVLALYEKGIINGMTATTFQPNGTLTRAQISKIIYCM